MSRPAANARQAGAADGARAVEASGALRDPGGGSTAGPAGRNDVILFVGDGMGLSTVTFSRIAEHGVDGDLFLDRLGHGDVGRDARGRRRRADDGGAAGADGVRGAVCGVGRGRRW